MLEEIFCISKMLDSQEKGGNLCFSGVITATFIRKCEILLSFFCKGGFISSYAKYNISFQIEKNGKVCIGIYTLFNYFA
jgi:hypothetical protein